MITGIIFIVGILVIGFLFLVHNAMTKPIYNKIHNVWEDDQEGRLIANITVTVMLFIAFYLGTLF